jgi:site-specific recombinase XerD
MMRLYQQQLHGRVPAGRREPLWRSLRAPFGALSYHGAHRMFCRVAARVGVDATLHALRHTAAFRMAQDPLVPLCDVQWVLGHASLSTTQIYTMARPEEVITTMLAHHQRRPERPQPSPPAPGYRPESLQTLFGSAAS